MTRETMPEAWRRKANRLLTASRNSQSASVIGAPSLSYSAELLPCRAYTQELGGAPSEPFILGLPHAGVCC